MADAAALLHRQCGLFHALENGRKVVLDLAQHKAVEQRDPSVGAGPGQNAARRQKTEIGDRF